MKRMWKIFVKGLVVENPLLMLMIGLCSSVAVTSSVSNGIGMGLAMTFVIVFAELVISLFRKLIPNDARIPIFIIVIAAFTTMVDLSMQAYFPALSKSMGVFIPLIVVNCIILGRAEAYASKNPVLSAALDGLGNGVGFTLAVALVATVREVLGSGTWFGVKLAANVTPVAVMIQAPGAFLTLGLLMGFFIWLRQWRAARA